MGCSPEKPFYVDEESLKSKKSYRRARTVTERAIISREGKLRRHSVMNFGIELFHMWSILVTFEASSFLGARSFAKLGRP